MNISAGGITLLQVKTIVDSGDKDDIKELITCLDLLSSSALTREAFTYIAGNTTGALRVSAFNSGAYYWDEKTFDENFKLVTLPGERLKILKRNKYVYLYPDEFIELWETGFKGIHFWLISSIPSLTFKRQSRKEWLEYKEKSRLYSLNKVDGRIFDLINSTILDSTNDSRQEYAGQWWADPDVLDAMKDDKYRGVINELAANPFIYFETAEYLISNYKTPGIRLNIARNARNPELLELIWGSTKSKNIRAEVLRNPFFNH